MQATPGARPVEIGPEPAVLLARTLDLDWTPREGEPLPPGWHWLYLRPHAASTELGPDGHPLVRDAWAAEGLTRRMWAGSRLRWPGPLRIGERASLRTERVRAEEKVGRSGRFVLVTQRHTIERDGTPLLGEEQDLVYRAPPSGPDAGGPAEQAPALEAGAELRLTPDPVLLFRYSALTFNGHRIHYDHPYVTGVEGYPGLVVHGPLLATLMLLALRDLEPGRPLSSFTFRGRSPAFAGRAIRAAAAHDGEGAATWVEAAGGGLHMDGRATFA